MNNEQLTSPQQEHPLRVVGISGSLRSGSLNTQALRFALRLAEEQGAAVQELDLNNYILPLYNDDLLINGMPEPVQRLRDAVQEADLLLLATPEYNHSVPGVLKNAIDWLSTRKNIFDGKIAAIFGVSNGLYGTLRAQFHLRQILAALNVMMVPQPQVFIRNGGSAFTPDGSLADEATRKQLQLLIERSIVLTKALKK